MSANFHITVVSEKSLDEQEFELYCNSVWNEETELVLFQNIHEILALLRPIGKTLQVKLNVYVYDQFLAISRINKKLKTGVVINDHKLSIREIEVLGLIMQGYSNKQISEKLFISFETVRSHRKNILKKTGAKNTVVLINYYHQTFFDKQH